MVYALAGIARNASGEPLADYRRLVGGIPNPLFDYGKILLWEEKFIEKEKKQVKRNRPYSYSFRVSETEKELIDRKVKASGRSRTDYLIRTLSDKPIVCIKNGNEILTELKRHGNNLNQAVKNNYFGYATERELLQAADECKKAYRKLSDSLGGG